MAYKRTTKSQKGPNGTSSRQTTTFNDKTGKRTYSSSQSSGLTRTTRNTNGDVWLTSNNNGWITKRKIVSGKPKATPKPRKARRKKPTTAGSPAAGFWLLVLVGIVVYTLFFK